MKTYYEVLMNNNYMNSFKTYSEACELKKELERKYRNAKVEIVAYHE